MKVSLNWLKKYVDIDVAPEVLCEKMTAQGFEVESMEKSSVMSNVVTAKIKQIQKHPDSDHLQICQGGVSSYKSAKEEGKTGSDLFWSTAAGVGKGAVVGGVGGGLIGATGGIVATFGAGSIAGTAAISGAITTASKATEVGILQYKKSKNEGKSSSQITRNVVESLFNNGVSIAGFSVASKTGLTTAKYAYGKFDRYVFSKAYNASNRRMPPFGKYLQKPVSTFGKTLSYTFAACNVVNTVYSAFSKDPEKRAIRRGYTLK